MLLIRPRDPLSFRLRFYLLLALAVLLSEMGPAEAQSYRNDEKDDDDDDGTGEKFSQKYEEEVWRAEGSEEQKQEEMKNEKSWEEKYKE